MERDFSKVTIKLNASGSWANLAVVDVERLEEAKTACETLAVLHRSGSLRFKTLDAEGGVIEQYGPTGCNGMPAWHEPKVRG